MSVTKTMMAAVIENGRWVLRDVTKSLKGLQAIVGGLIQIVPLDDENVTLYCNEEGKVLDLPVSAVWIDPGTGQWLDFLHGNLVAFGPGDEDGNDTPATEETLAILNRHAIPILKTQSVVIFQ